MAEMPCALKTRFGPALFTRHRNEIFDNGFLLMQYAPNCTNSTAHVADCVALTISRNILCSACSPPAPPPQWRLVAGIIWNAVLAGIRCDWETCRPRWLFSPLPDIMINT
jgi:hypothetical protein